MFVEQVKFLACIRVQHTKHPSSEGVTAHGVVPNCFFGFKVVVDHHRWMSLIGNLDLVVGGVGGNQKHKDLADLAGQTESVPRCFGWGAMRMGAER